MNVKLARIKKGLTQRQFAKLVGISNVTIIKIEKDDIDGISFGLLRRIAVALDSTVQELFLHEK
nr:MAG: helix-turn-helix domain protein [Bacteriophage sp.]